MVMVQYSTQSTLASVLEGACCSLSPAPLPQEWYAGLRKFLFPTYYKITSSDDLAKWRSKNTTLSGAWPSEEDPEFQKFRKVARRMRARKIVFVAEFGRKCDLELSVLPFKRGEETLWYVYPGRMWLSDYGGLKR